MLLMAEAGLHSFNYDSGRRVHAELDTAGLDNDAKHAFILKLHPNEDVGRLLLKRCGISFQVAHRQPGQDPVPSHETSRIPASRHAPPVGTLGQTTQTPITSSDPTTGYRNLPKQKKAQCTQALQQIGFSDETIEIALATLGVPPSGHHPPKQGEKGFLNQSNWPSTGENY